MKKVFGFIVVALVLMSCNNSSNENVDVRDSYVGTYSVKRAGTINMMIGTDIADSQTVASDTTYTVAKVGTNQLSIGGQTATLDGTKLTFQAQSSNVSYSYYVMEQKITQTGTLSAKSIVINDVYSGTWNMSFMGISMDGSVSGTVTETCTKK